MKSKPRHFTETRPVRAVDFPRFPKGEELAAKHYTKRPEPSCVLFRSTPSVARDRIVVVAATVALVVAFALVVFLKNAGDFASDPSSSLQPRVLSQSHYPGLAEIETTDGLAAGSLNWFRDDFYLSEPGRGLQAYRRCSGDRGKPVCLVLIAALEDPHNARVIALDLARSGKKQFPIAFTEDGLLFVSIPNIYLYDFRTRLIRTIAEDAWLSALATDGITLAYLTSYRSGGANVYVLDLHFRKRLQLTNFERKSPGGGQFIRWIHERNMLVFEMQDDRAHRIDTWSVRGRWVATS